MLTKIFISLLGLTIGSSLSYIIHAQKPSVIQKQETSKVVDSKKSVIGFLPFWLISEAKSDYTKYLNEITYFNLTIGSDGHIQKYTNPKELDPGWNTLFKDKFSNFGLTSSIALFLGKDDEIETLLENPIESAQNLTSDLFPIIDQFGFTKINIDVEKVKDSSHEERLKFIEFVKEVRNNLGQKIQISLDTTASSFVKETNLVNPKEIEQYVDQIIIMAYDYHHPGSSVTGPIAPVGGAGTISEYDVETAIKNALVVIPKEKLILGVPLYGYSWETINEATRSATIPYSYITYSNKKAENLGGIYDQTDKEMFTVMKDEKTGLFRQTFYPNVSSTKEKVKLAQKYDLGGIALWALGYEGETILTPLLEYLN